MRGRAIDWRVVSSRLSGLADRPCRVRLDWPLYSSTYQQRYCPARWPLKRIVPRLASSRWTSTFMNFIFHQLATCRFIVADKVELVLDLALSFLARSRDGPPTRRHYFCASLSKKLSHNWSSFWDPHDTLTLWCQLGWINCFNLKFWALPPSSGLSFSCA